MSCNIIIITLIHHSAFTTIAYCMAQQEKSYRSALDNPVTSTCEFKFQSLQGIYMSHTHAQIKDKGQPV